MNKIMVLGGGTLSPIRNHLSLCAPAFGSTARKIHSLLLDKGLNSTLYLTKLADSSSELVTNEDVGLLLDEILEDTAVKAIILNVAFCDYDVVIEDKGFHGERLKTDQGEFDLRLTPSDKVINKIRLKRPDIFLVGFKTTTNASIEEQFLIALKMMKRSKCNLVLANDTITRHNMIITPEESKYEAGDRQAVLEDLMDMIASRHDLTYEYTDFRYNLSWPIQNTSDTFQKVVKFLVENGGYLENNGNGFTPGHFCYRTGEKSFLCSQRKANHNLVFKEGMSKVFVKDDKFIVEGGRKASVGARSQWLMLEQYPEYDCIVHTHNALKEGSVLHSIPQKPFQCGSLECGINTLNGLSDFDGIKAVYLEKHGPNILFKSTDDSERVIQFIKDNVKLGEKVI